MTKFWTTRRWFPPLLLAAVVLPLYLLFRSISLDDFDSYSFALALGHFSLDLQQPQPPGFPVYIFLGRLLFALSGDVTAALTLLSALGGLIMALSLYGMGRMFTQGRPLAGVGAALLCSLAPMGWLTAEKALSDTPGLAMTLLAMWLLWRGRDDWRWLGAGSLLLGLSFGLRPQDGLPAALLLAWLTARQMWQRRSLAPLLWAGLPFITGVSLWLLPTLHAVGGLAAYIAHLNAHSAHVRQTDSLLAMGLPIGMALRARASAFANTLLLHTAGVDLHSAWGWREAGRSLAPALLVIPGLVWAGWRRREAWLLLAWAALVAGQVFVLETLDRPRLVLPLLPPLALLVARGWSLIRRPRFLPTIVLIGASFVLLLQGLPLAAQLATTPAPSAQAAAYVRANYPPAQTLVAAAGSFRSVQVELPDYRLLYLYRFDADAARAATTGELVRYVVLFDRDKFSAEALTALSGDGRYVPLEDRTFARDPRVHTQGDQVRLQVLTPADQVPLEALALPPQGCIDIGGDNDGRYLDRGWYRPEEIGGVGGRWAGNELTSTVRLYLEPGHNYRLTLRALAYPEAQSLSLQIGGRSLTQFALQTEWGEYTTTIPAAFVLPEQTTVLELVHTQLAAPFDTSGGASSDARPLTAAYDWLCLVAIPPP